MGGPALLSRSNRARTRGMATLLRPRSSQTLPRTPELRKSATLRLICEQYRQLKGLQANGHSSVGEACSAELSASRLHRGGWHSARLVGRQSAPGQLLSLSPSKLPSGLGVGGAGASWCRIYMGTGSFATCVVQHHMMCWQLHFCCRAAAQASQRCSVELLHCTLRSRACSPAGARLRFHLVCTCG